MNEFFRFFGDFVKDFSWRRVGIVVVIVLLIFAALVIYEAYTNTFRLRRLERATHILENLVELDQSPTLEHNDVLSDVYDDIAQQLRRLLGIGATRATISPILLKLLSAALPWLILVLPFFVKWRGGDDSARTAFLGTIVAAIPFAVVGALIPLMNRVWINYAVYPWGSFLLVIVLLAIAGKRSKRQRSGSGNK